MHSQGHPPPQGTPQPWPLSLVPLGLTAQLSSSSSSSSSMAQLLPPVIATAASPGIKAPVTY